MSKVRDKGRCPNYREISKLQNDVQNTKKSQNVHMLFKVQNQYDHGKWTMCEKTIRKRRIRRKKK
jgi:hypothetical protein